MLSVRPAHLGVSGFQGPRTWILSLIAPLAERQAERAVERRASVGSAVAEGLAF